MIEMIALLAAQSLAEYGFHRYLGKVFDKKETFINYLTTIIYETIEEYEKLYPDSDENGKFDFCKSQIILDEFLKFRLFEKKGYKINEEKILSALQKNTNIIKPSSEQLGEFFKIFDSKVNNNPKLKSLEIEEFHKEKIFEIYDKTEEILSLLKVHLRESNELEEFFLEEISEYYNDLKSLKPQSALKKLEKLDDRIKKGSKPISDALKANLLYLQGLCLEMIGEVPKSQEVFIQAYKIFPENINYKNRAFISYYFLQDLKYKELKKDIENLDDYNVFYWAINTFESSDIIKYIESSVPKNVLSKNHYKRLVLNYNLKSNTVDNLLLLEKLEVRSIPKELPEILDYDNLHHWIFMLNATSISFFQKTEITYWRTIERNESSIFFFQLSKLLAAAIQGSELDYSYYTIVFIYYWLENELEIKPNTLINLQNSYAKLIEKDSFKTVLYVKAILKEQGFIKALEIIESYSGEIDENILSIKAFCTFNITGTNEFAFEYFDYIKEVQYNNIQNICGYLIPTQKFNQSITQKLLDTFETKIYQFDYYSKLIKLLIRTFSEANSEITLEEINNLRDEFIDVNKLSFFIGIIYFENQYCDECVNHIKPYVDEENESKELALYVQALNSCSKTNQIELLRILRLWREKFSFNPYFINIELEIRQILRDWDEIINITNYALSKLPENEIYFTLQFISLSNKKLTTEIDPLVNKALKFTFKSSENAIKVASILLENKYYTEASEIIYNKAKVKTDNIARLNYFVLFLELPQGTIAELETVVIGSFVKFDIDGQKETMQIDENNLHLPIVNQSLGKHKNDSFSITTPLSKTIKIVRIIRIMDKFLALYDEIMEEISGSYSNLPVESITFESSSIEGINKAFIQNFGTAEAERKKQIEENFKAYYSYNFSFSELTISSFNKNYLESFYTLISPSSDGFCAIPTKILSKTRLNDYKNYVLDITSALLFYEISKQLNVQFERFIVSNSILDFVEKSIFDTLEHRKSKMSISFSDNKIIPHIYSDEFYDKRLAFLNEIKNWLIDNAEVIIPIEKIDVIRSMSKEENQIFGLEYLIETSLLAQRNGNLLITDDLLFFKYVQTRSKIINCETFLLLKFPSLKNEILEFLLKTRYLGVILNKDVIYSSYINKHKLEHQHIYNYVLKNISLKQNFNGLNILSVVDFLQELALNPTISHQRFRIDSTNILIMLISSLPQTGFINTLKKRIDLKFHLLGVHRDLIIQSLISALQILNLSK
jgi:hypothetical protein